jgi:hypothetical protein
MIRGATSEAYDGHFVSNAGDVNGDGCADIIIGEYHAIRNSNGGGHTYIIYGCGSNPASLDLSALSTAQGFVISGVYGLGFSVSSAGDFNGDGYADVIIGTPYASPSSRPRAGVNYLIYGSGSNPGTIDVSVALSSAQGFAMVGNAAGGTGWVVSTAGDVNGDGYADIIVQGGLPMTGSCNVIYGSGDNPGTVDLTVAPSGTQGFVILVDFASVSSAGDVNNDGYADIIIGSSHASPSAREFAGASYVIYGSSSNPGTIDLSVGLSSSQGFSVLGAEPHDWSGISVGAAGDVNGDGYEDIIIGAMGASPNSVKFAGASYVIYGSRSNPGTIDLSVGLNNSQGFELQGGLGDRSGISANTAGDVNGDGYADIIIGASVATAKSRIQAGKCYIVYGSSDNPGTVYLTNLTNAEGFAVLGAQAYSNIGTVASTVGDVNNDGYADIIVPTYSHVSGLAEYYVIYGHAEFYVATASPTMLPTTLPTPFPSASSLPSTLPTPFPLTLSTMPPTARPTNRPTTETVSVSGLSVGAMVGIAFGALTLIAASIYLLYWRPRRLKVIAEGAVTSNPSKAPESDEQLPAYVPEPVAVELTEASRYQEVVVVEAFAVADDELRVVEVGHIGYHL